MSELLEVDASVLRKVFINLSSLLPKGTNTMPVGVHIKSGTVTIVALQGCVYQAEVPTTDLDAIHDVTIMYHDISPLLVGCNRIEFEVTPSSLIVNGEDFSVEFPFGYSSVAVQNFSNVSFKELNNYAYLDSFKKLISMNLDKLYNVASPIIILGDVALQKYGNTWVQVRTTGLSVNATVDLDHIRLLLKFVPTGVCISTPNTLLFKNKYSVLQLPCKRNIDSSLITDLMKDMTEPVTVNVKSYLERVKNIAKLESKQHCNIIVCEKGLKTTVTNAQSTVSVSTGDASSKVQKVVQLPMQLWLSCLRGLDADVIQILTGGDKICLRTQSVIIVTHALV